MRFRSPKGCEMIHDKTVLDGHPAIAVRTSRTPPRLAAISALAVLCWTIVAAIVYIAYIALVVFA